MVRNGSGYDIHVVDEICLPPPANSTEQVCEEYSARGYKTPYFYGDASGSNQSQRKSRQDSRDHYEVVEGYFNNPSMNRVIRRNPPRAARRRVINRLLTAYHGTRIIVDADCKNFIKDLENLQTDKDGCYLKPKRKDKDTGVTYEYLGHCMDSFIYFLYYQFPEWFQEV